MSDIPLDEVVHFDVISSSSTGAAVDADSTPTFAVYEEATDTDIGVGGNLTKRTSLTGNYRGSFTASAANGFELGKWYNVIASATIGGIAAKGVAMRFRIVVAEGVAGYPAADVLKVGGTTQTARDLGASVLLSSGTGTGQILLSSGKVVTPDDQKVDVNTIKTNPVVNGGTLTFPTGATLASTTNITTAAGCAVSSIGNNVITAASTAADYVAEMQAAADAAITANTTIGAIGSNTSTILNRLGGWAGSGVNTILGAFKALFRSDASAPSDIGGTFDPATDSTEAIRNRGDSGWITATGFSTHSASDVWAVGNRTLSAFAFTVDTNANATEQAILADSNELQTDWANGGRLDVILDAIPTAAQNAAGLLDLASGIETSITPRQAMRLILAASAGKLSGAATATITIRNVGDSKDRITATVDADGNRTAVTVDAT